MMTAKERQLMHKLEIENRELRAQHAKHFEVYRDSLIEIIDLRARLELVEMALRGGD